MAMNNGATNQQLFQLFLTGVRPVLRDEIKMCNVVAYEGVDVTVQMEDGTREVQVIFILFAMFYLLLSIYRQSPIYRQRNARANDTANNNNNQDLYKCHLDLIYP